MTRTLTPPRTAPSIPPVPRQRARGTARTPLLRGLRRRRPLAPEVVLLGALGPFADVPERDLLAVAPLAEHLDLPAGARLLTERSVATEAWLLVRGVAQATLGGRVLGQAVAGELLGDLALLRTGFSPLTWDAVTDVSVLSVTPRELREVMRLRPLVADRLHGLS